MAGWSNNTPQFNLDENTQKLFLEKAKRRAELREEFLKLKFDPFRHASEQGGYLVDPAVMRHQAMKASAVQYFKPTSKTIKQGLFLFVIPVAVTFYLMKTERETREAKIRRGEVAYRDRWFKFV